MIEVILIEHQNGKIYALPEDKVDPFLSLDADEIESSYCMYELTQLRLFIQEIDGFEIPKTKASKQVLNEVLTVSRVKAVEDLIGKDLLDQTGWGGHYETVFMGWLMGTYPNISESIITHWNKNSIYRSINMWKEWYYKQFGNQYEDVFLHDFCKFANNTHAFKRKVNETIYNLIKYYTDGSHY